MAKILVVEDEPKVAGALKGGLETEGYETLLKTSRCRGISSGKDEVSIVAS